MSESPTDRLQERLEALTNLERERRFHQGEVQWSLDTMLSLDEALGHPARSFPSIHIGGSYGKGSVAAFAASILDALGERVGLYTSPHLVDVRERIRLGGTMVESDKLEWALSEVLAASETHDIACTYFEAMTAASFLIFRDAEVDIAVIEVGLGGRVDATNVVAPCVTVITAIGDDHQAILGGHRGAIAAEKAGILKRGVPVVLGQLDKEPRDVILQRARELECPPCEPQTSCTCSPTEWHTDLQGSYRGPFRLAGGTKVQSQSATLALAAVDFSRRARGLEGTVPMASLQEGLQRTRHPGRFQVIEGSPRVVVDVGHNPQGVRAAVCYAKTLAGGNPVSMVLGLLADKDASGILREVVEEVPSLVLTSATSPRSRDPAELQVLARQMGSKDPICQPRPKDALERARRLVTPDGVVLVAGSFYLAGAFLGPQDVRDLF